MNSGKSQDRARSQAARAMLAAVVAVAAAYSAGAAAQAYPNKPVSVVLPYGTGGTIDIQGRLLTNGLTQKLGQPFIARNMPGATGAIATEFVARAAPDGYTLLFASSAQTTSVPMTEKVNYKLDDLVPVSATGRGTMVLAINASVPAQNLKEFIDYAKRNPGKLNYGSSGTGSVAHLVAALFAARAGLDMVHIPYKGGGASVTDLMGGQIPMLFGNAGEVLSNAKNERIRIIGVSTQQRMKQLPNVPAVAEVLPGFEMTAWQGTLAPARTPKAIIDVLASAIQALSKDPTFIERMEQAGADTTTTTPEQMAAIIRSEQAIYAEAVKAAGMAKPQ